MPKAIRLEAGGMAERAGAAEAATGAACVGAEKAETLATDGDGALAGAATTVVVTVPERCTGG
jgi:hypothetical protein